jgi:hypothetical protein
MGPTGGTGMTGPTGVNYTIFKPPTSDPGVTGQVWWNTDHLQVSGLA